MITDVFFKRYDRNLLWFGGAAPYPEIQTFFRQITHIIFTDVVPKLKLDDSFFQQVEDLLAREMGVGRIYDGSNWSEVCGRFLMKAYDLWDNRDGEPDTFIKVRISLIELIFRAAEQRPHRNEEARQAIAAAISELNQRFREADLPLHYHNGLIQISQDQLVQEQIAEPCWSLLRDPKWANADIDLKEALDRARSGRSDAVFHAAKALESVIKIISDDKGWTTGKENGAANYIDNLVSQRNGRFIEQWESDMLKSYFKNVRNPHGHGPGKDPAPDLSDHEIAKGIETAMSWIKNLILRT